MVMANDFSSNLRSLCADRGSFAQVCREIGMNRQQFNRYLNGHGMPSVHNLHRIARHFNVRDEDLMLSHDEFLARYSETRTEHDIGPASVLVDTFRDQARKMRSFLGSYHVHFYTPSWPGQIMRSALWLREQDGFVVSRSYERGTSSDGSIIQRTRYAGLVAMRDSRIYLVERAFSNDGFVGESILYLPHRQKVKFIRGHMIGVAVRPRLAPYSSKLIWKKMPDRMSAREVMNGSGTFPMSSTLIDPVVRKYLASDPQDVSAGTMAV